MASKGLTMDQRRAWLLDHIGSQGRVSVTELCEMFSVSAVTVRTDLRALEESRLVRRVHGGAVVGAAEAGHEPATGLQRGRPGAVAGPATSSTSKFETTVTESVGVGSVRSDAREADALGSAAAELVSSGDAVLLDGGPVAVWMVKALVRRRDLRDVTICTNDLYVALELRSATPRFSAFLAGGSLRASGSTLVEPMLGPALDRMRADLCFLSCTGIDREAGVTGSDFEHAAVWQRYFRGARRRVLVAPGAAVGRRGQVGLAAVDDIDLLVTGAAAAPAGLAGLRDAGLRVSTVGPPGGRAPVLR